MDSVPYADLTIKIIGHQWYWTFEYRNFKVVKMINLVGFIISAFGLLGVF